MELQDICEIKTNFSSADFWVKPKIGSGESMFTKSFKKKYIGVKVVRTDLILVDYLYYYLIYHFNKKSVYNNNITEFLKGIPLTT